MYILLSTVIISRMMQIGYLMFWYLFHAFLLSLKIQLDFHFLSCFAGFYHAPVDVAAAGSFLGLILCIRPPIRYSCTW